jgi:2-C-methyl-D-erythritol 4-phosphate cytidylyltransferase / 2-C-methyl-D-erythritol 2,4-cyclodiphosphate synthase
MIIGLIVAGGFGSRYDNEIPKQYTRSILKQTIQKFLSSGLIDNIQIVIRLEDLELYKKETQGLELLPVCFGGETRSDSVKNGLNSISSYAPELVLVHDANRPFLSSTLIDKIISTLKDNPNCNGVAPTLPLSGTIKRMTEDGIKPVERKNLFTIQTPQGFYFDKLLKAFEDSEEKFTDESSLMNEVIYIPGEIDNIKITYKEDIPMKEEIRSGTGFDAHRFSPDIAANNAITLGGIKIPFEKKLEAHSDGDVLIHSLVDAILGSIGAGDIGMHFPPSDIKWKNADSKLFLIHANELLKSKNGRINNIDITVICEKPRLGKYREEIRNNLTDILTINKDRINIKATTTEKMGFTGREEGIAVQSICTVTLQL